MKTIIYSAGLLLIGTLCGCQRQSEPTPFSDAVQIWNCDNNEGFKSSGNVKTGLRLQGRERNASLERGGDGMVVQLDDGWIELEPDPDGAVNRISGHGFTFHVRVKNFNGARWDSPVVSKHGGDDHMAWSLYGYPFGRSEWDSERMQNYRSFGDSTGKGYALEFAMGFELEPRLDTLRKSLNRGQAGMEDKKNGIWRVGVPARMIQENAWHDITVTFNGPALKMYLDGNLVDKNFPLGTLRSNESPILVGAAELREGIRAGFSGSIDLLAVWDRALDEEEIHSICGGPDVVQQAEREIFGNKKAMEMHYLPRWHNAWINETLGADIKGSVNIYYSVWPRGWSAQASEIHTAGSGDLTQWQYRGLAIPVDRQWEGFWMSSMPPRMKDGQLAIAYFNFRPAGVLPSSVPYQDTGFYETVIPENQGGKLRWQTREIPDADRQLPEKLPRGTLLTMSTDGINFEKVDRSFADFATPSFLTIDEFPGMYFMTFFASLHSSKDFEHWEFFTKDLIPTGARGNELLTLECWFYLEWNGWHYMISGGGLDAYRSRSALGPYWEGPDGEFNDQFVPKDFIPARGYHVFSMFKSHDNRAFLLGMTPHWPDGRRARVSGILTIHELVQEPDGKLGSKWVREMMPSLGEPLDWQATTGSGRTGVSDETIQLTADDFEYLSISGLPESYHLSARVVPEAGAASFGLNINGAQREGKPGCEVRFDPLLRQVQYGNSSQNEPAALSPATFEDAPPPDHPLYQDDPDADRWKYWKERRTCPWLGNEYALADVEGLDEPFTLEVIVEPVRHNDKERARWWIIDTQIDERLAFVAQRQDMENIGNLSFFVKNGTVRFENIEIRPLQ